VGAREFRLLGSTIADRDDVGRGRAGHLGKQRDAVPCLGVTMDGRERFTCFPSYVLPGSVTSGPVAMA
jgi:hypothetical protein